MSRQHTFEQKLLAEANDIIESLSKSHQDRLALLEAVAAHKSGADVKFYRHALGFAEGDSEIQNIEKIESLIVKSGVPFEMAISSLAQEPLTIEDQKKHGVFYTDFRLASLVAEDCNDRLDEKSTVADLAAGTGILLVGVAKKYQTKYPQRFNKWISNSLFAYDMAPLALRGAAAAILSLTNDINAISEMFCNWKCCDSLLDKDIEEKSFDIVVGNPPWGKIKLSRHNFLMRNGDHRTYGSEYEEYDQTDFEQQKEELLIYSREIKRKFELMGTAEPDMYLAFMQRAVQAIGRLGHVSFLIPAGLIRSQGTKILREYLIHNSSHLEIHLLDNHANFFSIDSRFKFVLLSFDKAENKEASADSFNFSICNCQENKIFKGEKISFNVHELQKIRPDITIPEVRNIREADLFFAICQHGISWGPVDGIWQADVAREVDMTNDRKKFITEYEKDAIPVIEGRMVQQHRFGTKTYVSGRGRSAVWIPCSQEWKPQFYCRRNQLKDIHKRIENKRAGYCDIAGQTNERAMMSAIVPENVVCGNKVPTVIFPKDTSGQLIYLWVGITNSFIFDWMIRRIISTTVNYFLMFSVPMPSIDIESETAKRIVMLTKKLSWMQKEFYYDDSMAMTRAEIDVLIAEAYGLSTNDMELILEDFPLLDRRQPPINGESRSTVTRDLILSKCEEVFDGGPGYYSGRYEAAKKVNAKAYIPTEMTKLSIEGGN